ncbi:MAG: peptidoglycan editing factor PgeF [bacterium]
MKPEIPIIIPSVFLLFPQIRCAVSTRLGGVSPDPLSMSLSFNIGDARENVIRNRELFFSQLEIEPSLVIYPRQIHSCRVESVTVPGPVGECDALITDRPNLALAVTIADCTPILLFDPERMVIAAIHAGWRGTAQGIVERAVQQMIEKYSCSPSSFKAYIGPSAGPCCYEVGEDVASQFQAIFIQRRGERIVLDLKSANQFQLLRQGLSQTNIEIAPHCTICNAQLFHSYRRDREKSGRMMASIVMKQP